MSDETQPIVAPTAEQNQEIVATLGDRVEPPVTSPTPDDPEPLPQPMAAELQAINDAEASSLGSQQCVLATWRNGRWFISVCDDNGNAPLTPRQDNALLKQIQAVVRRRRRHVLVKRFIQNQ